MGIPFRLIDPNGQVVHTSVDFDPGVVGLEFNWCHKPVRITKVVKQPDGSEDRHIALVARRV